MISKSENSTAKNAEKNTIILKSMKRFLDRLTYINTLFIFQSKLISEQERQILILESENQELLSENLKLKQNVG